MEAVRDADRLPLSFLGRRLPPPFERRVVVLASDRTWVYDDAEWRGAILVVEHGQIELYEAAILFTPFRRLNRCQFDAG
jgi:hypothetical protein